MAEIMLMSIKLVFNLGSSILFVFRMTIVFLNFLAILLVSWLTLKLRFHLRTHPHLKRRLIFNIGFILTLCIVMILLNFDSYKYSGGEMTSFTSFTDFKINIDVSKLLEIGIDILCILKIYLFRRAIEKRVNSFGVFGVFFQLSYVYLATMGMLFFILALVFFIGIESNVTAFWSFIPKI